MLTLFSFFILTLFSFCLSRLTPFWFRHLTGWLGSRPKSWNFRARNRPRHCQRQKSDAQAAAAPPRSILCSSLLTLCLVLFLRVQKCFLSTSILAPKLRLKVNASHVFDVHRSARVFSSIQRACRLQASPSCPPCSRRMAASLLVRLSQTLSFHSRFQSVANFGSLLLMP